MTPEDLIGPAAAKALAEHFDLTPKAKALPEVVTREELRAAWEHYIESRPGMPAKEQLGIVLSAFVLRWLRARLEALPDYGTSYSGLAVVANTVAPHDRCIHRADTFKALTGREWTP